jgi:uroporphyrinogen decarboxylase
MDMTLTSRERVLLALNHQEPDRVPIVFGADGSTAMLVPAYENLKQHLGLATETRLFDRAFQYARIDEEVMVRFGSDVRTLMGPASSHCASVDGPSDTFTDYWGITWQRPQKGYYYDMVSHPLQGARTPKDIEEYPWPVAEMILDLSGLAERARRLRQESPYAIMGIHEGPSSLFEGTWYLRSLPKFMMDLAANPEVAHALLRHMTDVAKITTALFLKEVGQYIDIYRVGDDLGIQSGPMISPRMFRKLVKPYLAEYYAMIHNMTDARLMLHCCGSVRPIMDDLIEIGVDILHPVQVSAKDMEPGELKAQFGDRLCFCGGIDTQEVLPHGTREDVQEEVQRRIQELAPGGGYLLAAVHAIQPDVPPENVCAMFEAALAHGQYPIPQTPAVGTTDAVEKLARKTPREETP